MKEFARNDFDELVGQIIDVFEDALWDMGRVNDDEYVFSADRYRSVAEQIADLLKNWDVAKVKEE